MGPTKPQVKAPCARVPPGLSHLAIVAPLRRVRVGERKLRQTDHVLGPQPRRRRTDPGRRPGRASRAVSTLSMLCRTFQLSLANPDFLNHLDCLCMADIQTAYPTSAGTLTTPGCFAQLLKTTCCKYGRSRMQLSARTWRMFLLKSWSHDRFCTEYCPVTITNVFPLPPTNAVHHHITSPHYVSVASCADDYRTPCRTTRARRLVSPHCRSSLWRPFCAAF